jgi:hypothetical protein
MAIHFTGCGVVEWLDHTGNAMTGKDRPVLHGDSMALTLHRMLPAHADSTCRRIFSGCGVWPSDPYRRIRSLVMFSSHDMWHQTFLFDG